MTSERGQLELASGVLWSSDSCEAAGLQGLQISPLDWLAPQQPLQRAARIFRNHEVQVQSPFVLHLQRAGSMMLHSGGGGGTHTAIAPSKPWQRLRKYFTGACQCAQKIRNLGSDDTHARGGGHGHEKLTSKQQVVM